MPKVDLSLGFSFEKLFNKAPDPSKLCVFGCLCFPWLRPYSSHKLDPKSSPCVFLGYSLTQSAFLCYDPTLKKICVPVMSSLWKMCSRSHLSLPSPHHTGNRHRLCTPRFIVHLMRLSHHHHPTRPPTDLHLGVFTLPYG